MFRSLGARLGFIHFMYFTLLLGVIGATAFILNQQTDDGLVVNLSGRQRMLTQRMTHQLLGYASLKDTGKDTTAQRAAVLGSMQVFEKTLHALHHGGPAPLDLQMVNMRNTPPASVGVARQLGRVENLYDSYSKKARGILDGTGDHRANGVTYIIDHNTELLSEMNTAVNLMQAEAESRVRSLYYVQGAALLFGLLLSFVLSQMTRRTVIEPLKELNQLSDAMSRGDVHRSISAHGPREIHELGTSFERLRISMKNLLKTTDRQEYSSPL